MYIKSTYAQPEIAMAAPGASSRRRTRNAGIVAPIGGYGTVTSLTVAGHTYLICRTVRGRGGWGVHTEDGTLLVSGWSTRARAVAYAERLIQGTPAGGAR